MVAGQLMEKSGNNSHQKKISGTSRLANTSTRTMMRSNGHATGSVDDDERVHSTGSVDGDARVGMDLEKSVGQSIESTTNYRQKETPRSASSTSTSTTTKTTGMQKIDEGNEEEE
jgi:hypothetical protein